MTNEDAIKWLVNLKTDIGNPHYECLWPYAQAIDEICDLLEEREPVKTEPVRFRVVRAGGSNYPFWDSVCDGCGFKTSEAHTNWGFCPNCGKAVKWE